MQLTPLEQDIQTAITWLVDVSIELFQIAKKHDDYATRLIDKMTVAVACAELPGDMPLRIRLTPHVFELKA